MDRVLITHEVDDYAAWKAVFDAAAGIRRDAGEREYELMHAEDDPRTVVHLSTWTSLDDARAFFMSDRLVEIRRRAGVHEPEFRYLRRLETGTL